MEIVLEQVTYHCSQSFFSAVLLSRDGTEFRAAEIGANSFLAVQLAIIEALLEQGILSDAVKIKEFKINQKEIGGISSISVRIENNGRTAGGQGDDIDIVSAFAKALVDAINHLLLIPVEIEN